jgi:predicted homoserine dehydrogenase-like protein
MTARIEDATRQNALPIGIAKGAKVCRPVAKGQTITYQDVELPQESVIVQLRQLQDAWIANQIAEPHLMAEMNALAVQGI